jgi:ATP-dependent protease ClpP protease subunit
MTKLIIAALAALPPLTAAAKTLDLNPERSIYISGPIMQNSIGFASKIETLTKKDDAPIYLVINSPGGEVTLGYLIINAMNWAKQRGVKFVCYSPQFAASMAFSVLAACDERYTLAGTYLLWHEVRAQVMATMTPSMTAQMLYDFRMIERRMTSELLAAMNVTEKFFRFHYLRETLWTAADLNVRVPGFLVIVNDVTGLKEGYSQFDLRQTSTGYEDRRGYRFIYQAELPTQ